MQNAHWKPCSSTTPCCTARSLPVLGSASPSIVTIFLPRTVCASTEHEYRGTSSTSTVQAPHSARSQPSFVPVRPSLYRSVIASVSCGIRSTRRSWPFTLSVTSRSTAPAAGWPCSVVLRNRYAEDEAAAPAAITPLMKLRREVDSGVASGILLSSIAGSPRRVEERPDGEGFVDAHDNPVRHCVSTGFGAYLANVIKCHDYR